MERVDREGFMNMLLEQNKLHDILNALSEACYQKARSSRENQELSVHWDVMGHRIGQLESLANEFSL